MQLIVSFLKRISVSQKILILIGLVVVLTSCFYSLGSWFTHQQRTSDVYINLAEQNKVSVLTIAAIAKQTEDSNPELVQKTKTELEKNIKSQLENLRLIREGGTYKKYLLSSAGRDVQKKLLEIDTAFVSYQQKVDVLIHQRAQIKSPGDSLMKANPEFAVALASVQQELIKGSLYNSYNGLIILFEDISSGNQQVYDTLFWFLVCLTICTFIAGFYLFNICITKPVGHLNEAMEVLSKGNNNVHLKYSGSDEFGRLTYSVNKLATNLKKATSFTLNLENGDFSDTLLVENEECVDASQNFALALNKMKSKLLTVSDLERIRVWNTEGLAKFSEIQRINHNLNDFGRAIISELVRFTHACQGGFYLVNDENPRNIFLELTNCYAMGSHQDIKSSILPGEGLVGQSFLRKEKLFIDQIPDSYQSISSGLGEAKPACILIIPFLYNEEVQGILELTSFSQMKEYEVKFVEEIAGNIGPVVYSFRINDKTRQLLEETQVQAEMMKASEEDLRQNMEELNASREEISAVLREIQGKEHYLNEIINISNDSIFTLDKEFKIISYNKTFSKALELRGVKGELKGFNLLDLWKQEETTKQQQIALYSRVFKNETFEERRESSVKDKVSYYISSYAPVFNQEGVIIAASCFEKDISKLVSSQKETELLLQQSQAQTEELRAQEEELRQNMEELSATQEEISNVLREVQDKEHYLNELINISTDSIFTIDSNYKIISYNHTFSKTLEAMGLRDLKGFDYLGLFPDETVKQEQKALYTRVFKGEMFEQAMEYDTNGGVAYFISSYAPICDQEGRIIAASCFAKDITKLVTAQKEAEALLQESQAQSEMLLIHEEEMEEQLQQLKKLNDESRKKQFELEEQLNAINSKMQNAKGETI